MSGGIEIDGDEVHIYTGTRRITVTKGGRALTVATYGGETIYTTLDTEQRSALSAALSPHDGRWTCDDLPSVKSVERGAQDNGVWITSYDAETVLDMVVDHLNTHHPKPVADAAEWLERALNNPDERLVALDEARIEANIQRNRALRERDAAVARAEQAEREAGHLRKILNTQQGRVADVEKKHPAPAVTRADIEKAIRAATHYIERHPDEAGFVLTRQDRAVDAVCDLFGIEAGQATDPVEDAIRNGLNVWGTTEEGVRQIAESVRRAISNDGGENVL